MTNFSLKSKNAASIENSEEEKEMFYQVGCGVNGADASNKIAKPKSKTDGPGENLIDISIFKAKGKK